MEDITTSEMDKKENNINTDTNLNNDLNFGTMLEKLTVDTECHKSEVDIDVRSSASTIGSEINDNLNAINDSDRAKSDDYEQDKGGEGEEEHIPDEIDNVHEVGNITKSEEEGINSSSANDNLSTELHHHMIEEPKAEKEKESATTEKAKIAKKFDIQTSAGSVCDVCSKTVYPMERLMMDSKCYHKGCLKCCVCGKILNPTVVTKLNNNIFCKPHYIELFRKRGKYDDINVNNDTKHDNVGGSSVKPAGDVEVAKNARNNKDHIKKDLDGSKPQMDHHVSNRVTDVTKAWTEGRVSNNNNEEKKSNIEDTDATETSSSVKVKNIAAMFETN